MQNPRIIYAASCLAVTMEATLPAKPLKGRGNDRVLVSGKVAEVAHICAMHTAHATRLVQRVRGGTFNEACYISPELADAVTQITLDPIRREAVIIEAEKAYAKAEREYAGFMGGQDK